MVYTIDTAATIKKLEEAGCESKIALAIVEAISEAHADIATKADLELLRMEVEKIRVELTGKFEGLESKFEGYVAKVKWYVVVGTLAAISVIKALDYLLPALP